MNVKSVIVLLLVVSSLSVAILTPGCITNKPNMLGSDLLCGFTVRLRVTIHVGIGEIQTENTQGIMFSSEVKYRTYNISVHVSAAVISDGNIDKSLVTPVSENPNPDVTYPTGGPAVNFLNTVGQWAGQYFNDGSPMITVTSTGGTNDTTIAKPGKFISVYGFDLVSWEDMKEDAIQIASMFNFKVLQGSMSLADNLFSIPYLVTIPQMAADSVADTILDIEFYVPFGGRFIQDDVTFEFERTSTTVEIGWKTEYWNDPISGLANKLVSWASDGEYDYFFEPINNLFGTNFPREILRIDYSVAPYYKLGDTVTVRDRIASVPKSYFGLN